MSDSKTSDLQKQRGGPKVLRIGIVQNGKILDEREITRRETVSLGDGPKATFTITSDALPRGKPFELFECVAGRYFLRFAEGMDGRVQVSDSTVWDLAELRQRGKVVQRGGLDAVELTEESRGKVLIADVTILFQFKEAAMEAAWPVLPADVRGSILESIDRQFASILVIVAALQLSLIAHARAMPRGEPVIEELDQSYRTFIMPRRTPKPPKETSAPDGAREKAAETKAPEQKKPESTADRASSKLAPKKGDTRVDPEAAERERRAALARKVAGAGILKVLGAKRAGALSDVLDQGNVTQSIEVALAGAHGVAIARSAEDSSTRGSGSGAGVGIGVIGTEGGADTRAGVGSKEEATLSGVATPEIPEVDGGGLSEEEISRVLMRHMNVLRDCYEGALKRDRTLTGKLVLRFEVEESGRMGDITFEAGSFRSDEVQSCIARRMRTWRFPKSSGGSVFVAYPIIFAPAS